VKNLMIPSLYFDCLSSLVITYLQSHCNLTPKHTTGQALLHRKSFEKHKEEFTIVTPLASLGVVYILANSDGMGM